METWENDVGESSDDGMIMELLVLFLLLENANTTQDFTFRSMNSGLENERPLDSGNFGVPYPNCGPQLCSF